MTALMFIGTILIGVTFGIAVNRWDDHEDRAWRVAVAIMVFMIGMAIYSFGVAVRSEKDAYINSLEGNNPYKKEYIYKQVDSTYVIIDSVYVKK